MDRNEEIKRDFFSKFDVNSDSIQVLENRVTIKGLKNNSKSEEILKYTQDKTDKREILFEDCIFSEEISLSLNDNIKFYRCKFEKELIVKSNNNNILRLEKCDFSDNIKLTGRIDIIAIRSGKFKSIKFNNFVNQKLFISTTTIEDDFEIQNSPAGESSFGYIKIENCEFKNFTNIENIDFLDSVEFLKCKFNYIRFFNTNFKNANFSESYFDKADFGKAIFKGVTNFKDCTFGNEINAEKIIDLSEIVFEDNVYFDESIFNHFVAFHSTSFKKTASFYRVEFNTMPNFSPGDFQGILNLNNAKWFGSKAEEAFEFDIIKKNVQKAYSNHDLIENVINFRSSFCGIKNVLLGKQNLLDAKNFHKAELYCKEMELKYELADSKNRITQQDKQPKSLKKPKKEEINIIRFLKFLFSMLKNTVVFLFKAIVNTTIFIECIFVSPIFLVSYLSCSFVFMFNDMLNYLFSVEKCNWKRKISTWWYKTSSKNIIDFTKWFEYMSLLVYRNISDHHTNLNKIFHFTLLMIANFAISLFFIELINNYMLLHRWDDETYMILNIFFAVIFLIALWAKMDKIHYLHIHAIIFLFLIFFIIMFYSIPLSFILKKEISQIIFGLLFYILATIFSYLIFVQNRNTTIKLTRFFSYFGFILALITSPEIINPTLNIFNKENIENKNLVNRLGQTDYDILSNLTRLSFRNYNIDNNATFSESNIVNQKQIIISNKATLERIFGFLFLRNTKESLNKILENIDNPKKIDEILKDNKNRSVALDLAYAASGQYSRTLKDMEIKDEARLWLLKTLRIHKDEKEAREEITNDIEILADAINQSKEIMIRLKNIVEKYDEYLGIYKSIRLDKITSQTYKSTYILYVIIMILCLYSLTKTARKNSIIS